MVKIEKKRASKKLALKKLDLDLVTISDTKR